VIVWSRRFVWALVLTLWCSPALAADVTVLNLAARSPLSRLFPLLAAQTVNATASVASSAVDLSDYAFFGAWYQCTSSSGTPTVKVEFLQSPTVVDTDFVLTVTLESALVAETAQVKAISPPPMRYGQVKITGNAGNPADTSCSLTLFAQGGSVQ